MSRRAKESGARIIRYRGVVKRYGTFQALSGVDLDVHAGEVVCLIGPSGSGKSTLLRCTNALETIDGGEIEFEGARLPRDGRALRDIRRRMGMVFQSFELFPHLTALHNVAEGPRTVLHARRAEDRAHARFSKPPRLARPDALAATRHDIRDGVFNSGRNTFATVGATPVTVPLTGSPFFCRVPGRSF